MSRAKQVCGLTLRASASEDVRESIARTFSVDTRVAPSSLLARARRVEGKRCHPRRRREVGALLPRVGQRRVPHGGAEGGGNHHGQALAAALARGGGPLEAALGLGVGTRRRGPLSRPTLRRRTPIATTADVPFRALVFGDQMELGVTLWPRG